mmetsp:Transcript_11067/g.29716  ORF Transcript_11067/g.29716 Transcript_11067/m.29716 type:complete len:289 (+) Transcript_11067:773-1639(+)
MFRFRTQTRVLRTNTLAGACRLARLRSDARFVRLPASRPVLACGGERVLRAVDTASDNDDVRAARYHARRRVVLLPERVSARGKLHSRCHHDRSTSSLFVRSDRAHRYVAEHSPARGGCHSCRQFRVLRRERSWKIAFRAHLSEQHYADVAVAGGASLPQTVDDSWPRNGVRVDDVGPRGDGVHASGRLRDNRVANIGKLAVLKQQKLVLVRKRAQLRATARCPAAHRVGVRLETADLRADRICKREQLRHRRHIGGHAQIAALRAHDFQQTAPSCVFNQRRALSIRQ